jgi:hypothetical protein
LRRCASVEFVCNSSFSAESCATCHITIAQSCRETHSVERGMSPSRAPSAAGPAATQYRSILHSQSTRTSRRGRKAYVGRYMHRQLTADCADRLTRRLVLLHSAQVIRMLCQRDAQQLLQQLSAALPSASASDRAH